MRVRTNRAPLRPSVRVDGLLFLLALLPWLLEAESPRISAVVNAATNINASSVPVAARGAILSISGTNLASGTLTPHALPFPTAMGGTQVLFDGIAGALLYVSPNQINVQVPFELPDVSSVDMVVQNGGAASAPLKVTLLAQDPGIYVVLKSGTPVSPSKSSGRRRLGHNLGYWARCGASVSLLRATRAFRPLVDISHSAHSENWGPNSAPGVCRHGARAGH